MKWLHQIISYYFYNSISKFISLRREDFVCFENVWLRENECHNVVKNDWESATGMDIMKKIEFCGLKLQEWRKGISNEYKQKIRICREQLPKLRSRRDTHVIQRYNAVYWEYMNLLGKQKIYRKQRTKLFWLREGDRNTCFFHKHASTRKKTNVLTRIKDDNEEWCETNEEIKGVITEYFSQLF